jgi:hypothetical protein
MPRISTTLVTLLIRMERRNLNTVVISTAIPPELGNSNKRASRGSSKKSLNL